MTSGLIIRILIIGLTVSLATIWVASPVERDIHALLPTSQSPPDSPFKYLVTIVMENHPLNGSAGVIQNPYSDSPYVESLAKNYSLSINYHSSSHSGSLAQYLGMMSGNSRCNDDPVGSPNCTLQGQTIVDRLESSNRTWKAFFEDYKDCGLSATNRVGCNSSGCFMGGMNGGYLDNHNPFIYYPAIANSPRCSNILPANSQTDAWNVFESGNYPDLFLKELNSSSPANYIWLVPTHCDSFHGPFPDWACNPYTCIWVDCLRTQVQAGNKYLEQLVPQILKSKIFATGQAALFITFDEWNSHPVPSTCPNPDLNTPAFAEPCQILGLWIGPMVKKGYVSNNLYTHYSYLKTVESAWQLQPLTVNDTNAIPMTEFFNVPFFDKPSFTFSPSNPWVGETVTFTGSAVGGTTPYVGFNWDFGDGKTDTGQSVSHRYYTSGTLNVKLTVVDSTYQSGSTSLPMVLTDPLTTSFEYSPQNPAPSTNVTFRAVAGGGHPSYSYNWDFGDHSRALGDIVSHAYSSEGTFQVILNVTDSAKRSVIIENGISVAQHPISADFTATPDTAAAGDNVTLLSAVSGGEPPYTVSWDLGDGGTARGLAANHVYLNAGNYTLKLTVVDSSNHVQNRTTSHLLFVRDALCFVRSDCNFAIGSGPAIVKQRVSFAGNAVGGIAPYTFKWDFGDGIISYGNTIDHVYNHTGNYVITLIVRDSAGHSFNNQGKLTVSDTPRSANAPPQLSVEFLIIAFTSGALVSCSIYVFRHRIFKQFGR